MRHSCAFVVVVGVVTLVAGAGVGRASESGPKTPAVAGGSAYATTSAKYRKRPLEVTIYGRRRIGGYSYRRSDVTSTYSRSSPPPYMDVRQSEGGPFDYGFFFDSGIGPHGGNFH
jgi:hypothetical protein